MKIPEEDSPKANSVSKFYEEPLVVFKFWANRVEEEDFMREVEEEFVQTTKRAGRPPKTVFKNSKKIIQKEVKLKRNYAGERSVLEHQMVG